MTRVRIDLRRQTGAGDVPLDGYLRIAPVQRRVASDGGVTYEVLPTGFAAAPQSVIDVTPSVDGDGVCAYAVVEEVPGGRRRWVLVPDSADIVAYSDLAEVDPATLEPGAVPDPAWWAALTDYRAETGAARDEAVGAAGDAAASARSAESAATTATTAASSASDAAEAVAEDRAAVETAHGLVTDAALAVGLDADTAVRAAGDAVAARDLAVPAAATATAARDVAVAARDATLAAVVITGAGRPDVSASMTAEVRALVAAATSGAEFRSLDGPQGAWVWRKRGTTWVCVEGDTGPVDASPLLRNGWALPAGRHLSLRRIGGLASLTGLATAPPAEVTTNRRRMLLIPPGWRSHGTDILYAGLMAGWDSPRAVFPAYQSNIAGERHLATDVPTTAGMLLTAGGMTWPVEPQWPLTLTL